MNEFNELCKLYSIHFSKSSLGDQPNLLTLKDRWKRTILPILKTYALKTENFPQNYFDWEKNLMNFIIENQIVTREEIDLDYVENNLCPGQTRNSLGKFISILMQNSAYHGAPNEPLYQACLRRLNAPYKTIKPEKRKIKEIEAIVRLYEKYKR